MNGDLLVTPFSKVISSAASAHSKVAHIWTLKAPSRVIAFGWTVILGRILTMNNLQERKKILVNGCLMCLAEAETVNHLLLNCKVAQKLWNSILTWFDCSWLMPTRLSIMFEAWSLLMGSVRGRVMWKHSFLNLSHYLSATERKELKMF